MDKANEVMKPMSVARADFISSLTDLINNCMLPTFVIEPILKDMYNDIHLLSQKQLEKDRMAYQEQMNRGQGTEE